MKKVKNKKPVDAQTTKIEEMAASVPQEPEAELSADDQKNHIVFTKTEDQRSQWYVVHTYSGHETKVTETLRQRVKTMSLENKIHEILVPTQEKIKIQRGKKIPIKEKIFPGYILVKLILDEDSWLAVRTTHGITGFVGTGNKPTPIPPEEVQAIKKFMKMEAPKYKTVFAIGDAVRIIEGPFADFLGSVDSIDEEKGKVRVLVSIFDRETPVELDFLQVTQV